MGFLKTGIINKDTQVTKIETEEELEKFAKRGQEQIEKASDQAVKENIEKDK